MAFLLKNGFRGSVFRKSKRLLRLKPRNNSTAFTIVEMLVATVLLAMISLLLFKALSDVTNITAGSQAKSLVYQDMRIVLDQIGRELEQTTPLIDGVSANDIFQVSANHLHFVAVIDNNTGHEEAEMHYYYDGTNTLYKATTLQSSSDWDFKTSTANGWKDTPALLTDYYPVLEGVSSFSCDLWSTNTALSATPEYTAWSGKGNEIPAYVRVRIQLYDSKVIRRCGTARNVTNTAPFLTNSVYSFNTLTYLPRSHE